MSLKKGEQSRLVSPALPHKLKEAQPSPVVFSRDGISLFNRNVMNLYDEWEEPVVIISDGAYGLKGFPGDPPTPDGLPNWYKAHIAKWSERSTPLTTLWFWNTEYGWAKVHPLLEDNGWMFKSCHIWDKGMAHAAGNSNTQNLSRLPIVTEVCVQYIRKAEFKAGSRTLGMKEWIREEWERTGIPLSKSNEACGVNNAATRKYLTKDHLFYYPPPDAFERLVTYANRQGEPEGRPYFSIDGVRPISKEQWSRMRAKFHCPVGVTNVWREPPLHGKERFKLGSSVVHLNQKPLRLMELTIQISSDLGDMVWEPFGGLCTAAIASYRLGRRCRSAEVVPRFYELAKERLAKAQPMRPHAKKTLEAF